MKDCGVAALIGTLLSDVARSIGGKPEDDASNLLHRCGDMSFSDFAMQGEGLMRATWGSQAEGLDVHYRGAPVAHP